MIVLQLKQREKAAMTPNVSQRWDHLMCSFFLLRFYLLFWLVHVTSNWNSAFSDCFWSWFWPSVTSYPCAQRLLITFPLLYAFWKPFSRYVSFSQRFSHDRSSWQRSHLFNLSSSSLRLVFQKPLMGINCWTLAAGSTDSTGRNVGCALKFHFMRSAHFSFVAPDSWGRRSCSSTYLVTYGWILRYLWQVRLIEYKPVLVLLSKCEAWASRRLRCMLWTEKVNLRSLGFHVHWWIPYDSMRDPPCILFFFFQHLSILWHSMQDQLFAFGLCEIGLETFCASA